MTDYNKSFAIYINAENSIAEIENIRSFISIQYPYSDIFVCCDDNVNLVNSLSIVPSFYLKFFQGSIIFTSLDDYALYQDSVKLAKVYIIVKSAEDILNNDINSKYNLKDAVLLTITDGEIHEV